MLKLKPALQYSEGRSLPWSGSKLVNCYSERADGDKRDDFAVMAIPGLDLFATLGDGPCRGSHVMGDFAYILSGASLQSLSASGVSTQIGTIPGAGLARIADNGSELAIATSGFGRVWSGGVIVTPPDLPAVSDVAFIDGYFVWPIKDTNQFIISDLNDGTAYDPLDIASVEGEPSNIVGVINDHRELHFYKKKSIEIWYNSGAGDFPFERQGNAFIERGCISRDTIVKIDNSVHFVGDDLIVYRLEGYSPVRISTHAVEYQIAKASEWSAFTYTQEGHKFYCLTTDVGTWCFDMATGAWHERKSDGLDNWRVNGAVLLGAQVLLTDGYAGKVYKPDFDIYTEDGEAIRCEIYLPTIEGAGRQRVTMYAYECLCETGVGLNSGQGADPQIMLQYSDDGGRRWSNELWRSMGLIGDNRHRAIWRKLGQFRQRQMRLTITDHVRRFVMSHFADIR